MYRTIQDCVKDWNEESALTMKVLSVLTDTSLSQPVTEQKGRTLGELAWHLVTSVSGMLGAGGLQVNGPGFTAAVPDSAQAIQAAYREVSEAAIAALTEQWTNEKLAESLMLFGVIDTTYGGLLNLVVRHQIHHRGQMTILMRQAGLVPPGVYGPNEEESAAFRADEQV